MGLYAESDVKSRRGMPYGGMPRSAILEKMEVTPGDHLDSGDGLTGIYHKDFMVQEIMDRTPDPGFLASDAPRRNPQHSRSILNLHFNTTRGSSSEMPRHPDLFIGFTGNDPRGNQNIPRFEKARGHMTARFRQLEPRMGRSVGHDGGDGEAPHQVAERPWTGPALQRARVDNHKLMRDRLKVFTTSKNGRSTGRNVVSDERGLQGVLESRRSARATGDEQWNAGDGIMQGATLGHEFSGDRGGDAREGFVGGGGGLGIGRGHDAARGAQLGRLGTPTADMAVARYSQGRSRRSLPAGTEATHQQRSGMAQQQELGRERIGVSTGANRGLALAMSAAAQSGRANAERNADNADSEWGAPEKTGTPSRGARTGESDVALAYFQSAQGHEHGTNIVGRAAMSGGVGALAAKADASGARQQITWKAQRDHARSALALSMAQETRRGASQQEAGDAVQAMYESIMTNAVAAQPDHAGDGARESRGRGITPGGHAAAGGGYDKAKQQSAAGFQTAAASRELAVANYKGSAPVESGINLATLAAARGGMPLASAEMARHADATMYSTKTPEYRGNTQMSGMVEAREQQMGIDIGDRDERGFATHGGKHLKALRYDRVDGALGADDTLVDALE
jgi:hypothetical protein